MPFELVAPFGFVASRCGVPFVLPLVEPAPWSVGEGVVGLTLGPDWLAGAGELGAKAMLVDAATIKAAIAIRGHVRA